MKHLTPYRLNEPSLSVTGRGIGLFQVFQLRQVASCIQRVYLFNCLEFEAIKLRIVKLFPESNETNGVAITHPVLNMILGTKLRIISE